MTLHVLPVDAMHSEQGEGHTVRLTAIVQIDYEADPAVYGTDDIEQVVHIDLDAADENPLDALEEMVANATAVTFWINPSSHT